MGSINNIIDIGFELQVRLELNAQVFGYGCSLDTTIREDKFGATGVWAEFHGVALRI